MKTTVTLSRLFAGIQEDMEQVDHLFRERSSSGLDLLHTASVHAHTSSGKRLRTALTLLSGKLHTYNLKKLLPLSVAFEMVHLASLIHDDIIDEATTRRGEPTVNALWGDKIAILLGDYYFAKTAHLIAEVEDFRIDKLFSNTIATVSEGSILEMMVAGKLDLSLNTYYEKISHKTACLIAACSKGGAIVSDASDEAIEYLHQYGMNLGIAFQIIDDILDYAEDQQTIGKPAGNDLRQGMVTLPLIHALQEDSKHEHHNLIESLLNPEEQHREGDYLKVVQWVNERGVPLALMDAQSYAQKARECLSHFPATADREVLNELVDFVIARNR